MFKEHDRHKSIFNITRASYINAGYTSDYFRECYEYYCVLSFSSHNTNKEDKTKFTIYKNGEVKDAVELVSLPKNPPVLLVPFYQLFFCLSIVWSFFILKFKYKIKPEICVTSFSLWSLTSHLMRILGFCKRTIFWTWDYFPKVKEDPYYMLLHIIEPFDKLALNICDYAWYASQSNFDKRVEIGQVKNPDDPKHKVVHWGTGGSLIGPVSSNYLDTGILRLVYFGSINPEKGLDILFESLPRLIKLVNGKLEILIIGGDTEYKKELQKEIKKQGNDKYVKFYGFMSTDEFDKIAETCDLGLALFVPEIGGQPNFSYYADPSKPRDYLANGLPVLITAVPFIHKDIQEYNAGIVLDKYSAESLVLAVSAYVKNPSMYKKGAYKLAQVDRYDVYYGSKFGLVYKDLQN